MKTRTGESVTVRAQTGLASEVSDGLSQQKLKWTGRGSADSAEQDGGDPCGD